jgi:hypothetical protein
MGCSSGKQHANIKSLKIEKVGVHSIDKFCDQIEEIINRFADLTDDLEQRNKKLGDLTGFWWYSGSRLKHNVLGMLL